MSNEDPYRIDGLSHAGITVSDLERSLAFYRDGLGLEVYIDRIADHDYLREVTAVPSDNVRIVYVRIPGSGCRWSCSSIAASSGCPCDRARATRAMCMSGCRSRISTRSTPGWRRTGSSRRSGHPVDITAGPFRRRADLLLHRPRWLPGGIAAATCRQARCVPELMSRPPIERPADGWGLEGAGVIVTGAAGGIGSAVARAFAAAGARVAAVDIVTDRLDAIAAALPGTGHIAFVGRPGRCREP